MGKVNSKSLVENICAKYPTLRPNEGFLSEMLKNLEYPEYMKMQRKICTGKKFRFEMLILDFAIKSLNLDFISLIAKVVQQRILERFLYGNLPLAVKEILMDNFIDKKRSWDIVISSTIAYRNLEMLDYLLPVINPLEEYDGKYNSLFQQAYENNADSIVLRILNSKHPCITPRNIDQSIYNLCEKYKKEGMVLKIRNADQIIQDWKNSK